ncbi:MAG: DUF2059 domain-containing protein [Beijerinckiaceae bacterium]
MHGTMRSILAAGALALLATAAAAQTPPAQPGPAAAAPAQPTFTDSHLAAARDVVVGSGLSRGFEGMAGQIADQIRVGYSRTRPELIKDLEEVLKPIVTEFSPQTEPMIRAASRLFATRMTEPELKEVGAFFKTPAGQKYVVTQGPLVNELYLEMQVFSQTLGNLMMDKLRAEMQKKGHQL